jgi:hypothetical protein
MLTDNRICLYCWIMPHLCIYSSILQYFNTYTVTFCVLFLLRIYIMGKFVLPTSSETSKELMPNMFKFILRLKHLIQFIMLLQYLFNILGISSLLVSEEVGSTNLPIMYILNKMYCFSNTHNMSNLSWTCKYCSHYSSCVASNNNIPSTI